MSERQIVISEPNARVLRSLLRATNVGTLDQAHLHDLSAELDRALVVDPGQMSPTIVSLNASVRVRELESGDVHEVTLVSPREADVGLGRISVLAPLGTALLGCSEGDEVERDMPGGPRRFLIEAVQQLATAGSLHAPSRRRVH